MSTNFNIFPSKNAKKNGFIRHFINIYFAYELVVIFVNCQNQVAVLIPLNRETFVLVCLH